MSIFFILIHVFSSPIEDVITRFTALDEQERARGYEKPILIHACIGTYMSYMKSLINLNVYAHACVIGNSNAIT